MQPQIQQTRFFEEMSRDWIEVLNNALGYTDLTPHSSLSIHLSAQVVDNQPSLFLPPEMAELQPGVLRYLHALGAANNVTLVETHDHISFPQTPDDQEQRPPDLTLGVSLLLKQTGLPGPAHGLSVPHRLHPDNQQVELPKLIRIAASVYEGAKKVVFLPNRFLTGNFSDQSTPMTGYACNVVSGDERTTVTYFNSPEFHAVGYISNDQFVLHILHAGGPLSAPMVWSPYTIMSDSIVRCQVFRSTAEGEDCGILYSTFYIDLEKSMEDETWWKDNKPIQLLESDS